MHTNSRGWIHFWNLSEQFGDVPDAVSDSGLHGWRDAQTLVNAAKIVIGEVQAERGPRVLPLAREAIRQSGESSGLA